MAKTFTLITKSGQVVVSGAAKSVLVNTGARNMFLTSDDTDNALGSLPDEAKYSVLNSLYAIKPGEAKTLAKGTYNLGLDWNGNAVLFVEAKSAAPAPAPPAPAPPQPEKAN